MREKKMRMRKRQIWQDRMALLGVVMVVVSLGSVIFMQNGTMSEEIALLKIEEARLEKLIEEENERAVELEELRVYMQTDQYYVEVAKKKLGLVLPNEVVIRPSDE